MLELVLQENIDKHTNFKILAFVPANKHGIASRHIFRRHNMDGFGATMMPATIPEYQFQFNSLQTMAKALREELEV